MFGELLIEMKLAQILAISFLYETEHFSPPFCTTKLYPTKPSPGNSADLLRGKRTLTHLEFNESLLHTHE